jgi:DNA polymerase III alpha subunit
MAFVQIEDLTGATEIVVFPGVLEKDTTIWESSNPIVVDGRISLKDGAIKILASQAYELGTNLPPLTQQENNGGYRQRNFVANDYHPTPQATRPRNQNITIIIPNGAKKSLLQDLKTILEDYPGPNSVQLMIPKDGGYQSIKTKATVEPSEELTAKIRQLVGAGSVAVI